MQKELQKTERELRIKNYNPKTIKSYLYGLQAYFSFKANNYSEFDQENIKNFLLHCEQKQVSPQSRNLFLNAIKFYYRNVTRNLQKIEIRKIIESSKNPKHKLLLSIAYGAGLRVGEAISLKVHDLDLDELTIHIKQAKGQKDRISVIPESIADELRNLVAGKTNNDFVFASERGGKLATRTALMFAMYKNFLDIKIAELRKDIHK